MTRIARVLLFFIASAVLLAATAPFDRRFPGVMERC